MNLIERMVHKSESLESRTGTANCALTPSLLKEVDALVRKHHFKSRSDLFYQALLYYIHHKLSGNVRE